MSQWEKAVDLPLFLTVLAWLCVIASSSDYSLTNLPAKDSSIVTKESTLDTEKLIKSFQHLGSHAEIAYYATIAYQTTEFRDKARAIHEDVSALKERSITTFNKFEKSSNLAIEKLGTAFEHVSRSEPDKAHPLIKEVGEDAKKLAEEAKVLYTRANTDQNNVQSVLQEIYNSRGSREREKADIEKQEQDLLAQKSRHEAERQAAEQAAADSANRAEQARRDADHEKKKKKKKCKGLLGKLKCKLASAVNWNLVKKYEKREAALRQEAASHSARAREQQDQAAQALHRIQQTANALNEARNRIKLIEDTAAGLQSIVTEYNGLTVALQSTNTFWEDMVSRCEDLLPKERYLSPDFQEQAIKFYTRWLSLNKDSGYFVTQVKPLAAISSDQPSVADARGKIKKIKDEL